MPGAILLSRAATAGLAPMRSGSLLIAFDNANRPRSASGIGNERQAVALTRHGVTIPIRRRRPLRTILVAPHRPTPRRRSVARNVGRRPVAVEVLLPGHPVLNSFNCIAVERAFNFVTAKHALGGSHCRRSRKHDQDHEQNPHRVHLSPPHRSASGANKSSVLKRR